MLSVHLSLAALAVAALVLEPRSRISAAAMRRRLLEPRRASQPPRPCSGSIFAPGGTALHLGLFGEAKPFADLPAGTLRSLASSISSLMLLGGKVAVTGLLVPCRVLVGEGCAFLKRLGATAQHR